MEPVSLASLGHLSEIQPPNSLLPRILTRLQELRLRRLRMQLGGSVLGFLVTTVFTIWNWPVFGNELGGTSPFWGMIRLVKTDPDIVLASAREFASGLLESLPIESIVVGLVFLFLGLSLFMLLQALHAQRIQSLRHHLS